MHHECLEAVLRKSQDSPVFIVVFCTLNLFYLFGGIAGGAVAGFMGAKAFAMGYSSILGVVIFEKTMGAILAGVAVSFVVSFLCTYVLYDGKGIK